MFRCSIDTDIELRLFEERHAAGIFAAVDRNRRHLRRWLAWVDRTQSVEDVREFVREALDAFGRGEEMHTGIWVAGAFAGAIGHHRIDAANRNTSIGYWLDAAHEGKGIVTRACRALLDHLFEERGLHRVEIRCATANTRSCAIPERLGFTREGVARGAELVNGVFYDLVVWSMLAEEWRYTGSRLGGAR